MICPEFEKLTPNERVTFIGKLVHAVQNSTGAFNVAHHLLSWAENEGVFANVIINPPTTEETN